MIMLSDTKQVQTYISQNTFILQVAQDRRDVQILILANGIICQKADAGKFFAEYIA